MQQIQTDDKLFHDGDGRTTQGTIVSAAWLNSVQQELVNLVEGAGLKLDSGNQKQVLAAILALFTSKIATAQEIKDKKATKLIDASNVQQVLKNFISDSFSNGNGYTYLPNGKLIQIITAGYDEKDGSRGTILRLLVSFPKNNYQTVVSDTGEICHPLSSAPISASTVRVWAVNSDGRYVNSGIRLIAFGE